MTPKDSATSRVKQSGLVISGLLNLKDTTKYGYCMFKVTSSFKFKLICASHILYIVPTMIFSIRMTIDCHHVHRSTLIYHATVFSREFLIFHITTYVLTS